MCSGARPSASDRVAQGAVGGDDSSCRRSAGGVRRAVLEGMLRAALAFFVVAIVAALFGFTGIAAGAAGIAKILFYTFAVLAVLTVVIAVAVGRRLAT